MEMEGDGMSSCKAAPEMAMKSMPRSRGACAARRAPPVGKANAARVSRGSMVDKLDASVVVARPVRDPSQHVTVTVVIYNTVAGGVPSAEDVKAVPSLLVTMSGECCG